MANLTQTQADAIRSAYVESCRGTGPKFNERIAVEQYPDAPVGQIRKALKGTYLEPDGSADQRARKRYNMARSMTIEQMVRLYESWQASGLTQQEFAKDANIPLRTLQVTFSAVREHRRATA